MQSRYYNPKTGRFLNADAFTSTGDGTLGNNMFAYCGNNPVMYADPTGHFRYLLERLAKHSTKGWAMYYNLVLNIVEKELSKYNGTASGGLSLSGSAGPIVGDRQIGVSIDTTGDVAIQATKSGGGTTGTFSAAVAGYFTVTNAPSISKLEGLGGNLGGSAIVPIYSVPVLFGADANIVPDFKEKKIYTGSTSSLGFAIGSGMEGHVMAGWTKSLDGTKFNAFRAADNLYRRIMEW